MRSQGRNGKNEVCMGKSTTVQYYSNQVTRGFEKKVTDNTDCSTLVSFEMLIGTIFIVTDKMHTQRHLFSCADSPIQVFLVLIDFMTK